MNNDRYLKKLKEIIQNAYVPYSHFGVACLLWTDKGWYSGVNVENAAYSPTLCAERNAIGSMVTAGAKKINRVWILTETFQTPATPCGVCRQVLSELASADTLVITYNMKGESKTYKVSDLLPFSFSKQDMDDVNN